MSLNWLRTCTLTVGGTSINGGGPSDLRIVFAIEQGNTQTPDMAHFRVYNPSPSTKAAFLAAEGSQVSFTAGYESNSGLIFSGDLKQSIAGHETAVDSYVDVFAADGDQAYIKARTSQTLAKGWTPHDRLMVAINAMSKYGVTLGPVGINLSQPKYPRGIPLVGMARDIIRQVVLSKQGLWSIKFNKVVITDKNLQGAASGVINLSPATGLIGWPKQTQDGITVRSLLNPALQPNQQIQLDASQIILAEQNNNPLDKSGPQTNEFLQNQNALSGTYTIYKINRHGDTRGQDWYDESVCIGKGGSLPPSASELYSTPFS